MKNFKQSFPFLLGFLLDFYFFSLDFFIRGFNDIINKFSESHLRTLGFLCMNFFIRVIRYKEGIEKVLKMLKKAFLKADFVRFFLCC